MYNFFTCFNRDYIASGVTLLRSLEALKIEFRLTVCALDAETFRIIDALGRSGMPVAAVPLEKVEAFDPEFAAVRGNRSFIEYIFTLSPVLPRFMFAEYPEMDVINYVDADLFFFREPVELYREFEKNSGSVLIMEHGFTPKLEWRVEYGRFNVGFQLYRRGSSAPALDWWRGKCLEWCCDRLDRGRFADQKYLDEFPRRFQDVVIARDPRAGIAPWNWPLRPIMEPVFYHFQGFRFITRHFIDHNLGSYANWMPRRLMEQYYRRYASAMLESAGFLKERFPESELAPWHCRSRSGAGRFRRLLSALKHRNLMLAP